MTMRRRATGRERGEELLGKERELYLTTYTPARGKERAEKR